MCFFFRMRFRRFLISDPIVRPRYRLTAWLTTSAMADGWAVDVVVQRSPQTPTASLVSVRSGVVQWQDSGFWCRV